MPGTRSLDLKARMPHIERVAPVRHDAVVAGGYANYLVWLEPGLVPDEPNLWQWPVPGELKWIPVYKTWADGCGLRVTPAQLAAVREFPWILRIEMDTDDQLAPHLRAPEDERVPGEYIVSVRHDLDPTVVAERAGIRPARVFRLTLRAFSGPVTDGQIEQLRRDPDVESIKDDVIIELDD